MALKWKTKIILAKTEVTYGVDPTPTGAANAVLCTDVSLNPMDGQDISRALELPYLGGQPTIPAELKSTISFKVELVGSGDPGTAPAWAPLLKACAVEEAVVADTSVTYNPTSDTPASLTFYMWIAGTRYAIRGARGNCTFRLNAQAIPYMEFEFTGMFTLPSEQTRPSTDLTDFQNPFPVNSVRTPTFSIGETGFVMRNFGLLMGNTVEGRFLVGSESIIITDRADQIECTVEAVPLSTFDPYNAANEQADLEVVIVHGNEAGRIVTMTAPAARMQRPQGLEQNQNITEWPLRMVALPSAAGDDQWTVSLT